TADKAPPGARPDAAAPAAPSSGAVLTAAPSTDAGPSPVTPAQSTVAAPLPPSAAPAPIATDADADATPQSISTARAIADQVAKSAPSALSGAAPDLTVRATSEGTLMRLTDDAIYSMFAVGSAKPDAKVVTVLNSLAQALASEPGSVIIRG